MGKAGKAPPKGKVGKVDKGAAATPPQAAPVTQDAPKKHAGGRPSLYTVELAEMICREIAAGKSLNRILKAKGMPDYSTVSRWLILHSEFRNNYARAREDQADTLADEIIDIADDSLRDHTEDGEVNAENIQRSRLMVDARKWVASKLKPKKYGERLELNAEVLHRTPDTIRDTWVGIINKLGLVADDAGTASGVSGADAGSRAKPPA